MPSFLSRLPDDTLRRLTARASVGVATLLIAAKLGTYWETGSVALLSSLVDSTIDLLASLITAYGITAAGKPPDRDHRFGHGKAEALAAAAQMLFILGSCAFLVFEALGRIMEPRELTNEGLAYAVMGFAVVMTLLLLALQSYAIRRTGSLAIASDRLHYTNDVLINLAVMAAFFFQKRLGLSWIDPLFAFFIAGGMFWAALSIGRRTLDVLMDAELSEKDRSAITKTAQSVPGVLGIHDLRTRSDSDRLFIEFHAEMNPGLSLREAQHLSEAIVHAIKTLYSNADILIHPDPAGHQETRLDTLIEENGDRP